MSLPVILRHGTKAQMDSYGPMQPGEVGFTIDEGFVYGSDGSTNYLIGRAISGSSDPSTPRSAGLLYCNVTTSGLWFSTGTGWVPVGNSSLSQMAGNLDSISDGSTYARVKASELSSGHVTQINDGTHVVTANQARTHIDDSTIHRSINDSATSSTALWSSQKINDSISAQVLGAAWQNEVLSATPTPPISPNENDRYVVGVGATGVWLGKDNSITQFITASGGWVFELPQEGWTVSAKDVNRYFNWNGSAWVSMASVIDHDSLNGLQGGQSSEYYHLTLADFNALTTNRNPTIWNTVSGMVSGGTQTGIVVTELAGNLIFSVNLSNATPATTVSGSASSGSPSTNVAREGHTHTIGLHPLFDSHYHDMSGFTNVGYVVGITSAGQLGFFDKIDGGTF